MVHLGLSKRWGCDIMRIGDKVFASCDECDIEGVVVAGYHVDTGMKTSWLYNEIEMDNVVSIRDSDNGVHRVNGWLWTFDVEPT